MEKKKFPPHGLSPPEGQPDLKLVGGGSILGGGVTEGQVALFWGILIAEIKPRPHLVRSGPAWLWVETDTPWLIHKAHRKPGQGGLGQGGPVDSRHPSASALLSRQALFL